MFPRACSRSTHWKLSETWKERGLSSALRSCGNDRQCGIAPGSRRPRTSTAHDFQAQTDQGTSAQTRTISAEQLSIAQQWFHEGRDVLDT